MRNPLRKPRGDHGNASLPVGGKDNRALGTLTKPCENQCQSVYMGKRILKGNIMRNTLWNIVKCKEMRWGIRAAAVTSPCSASASSLENVRTMSGTSVLHAGCAKHSCRLERVFASCRKRTRRGPDYHGTPDVCIFRMRQSSDATSEYFSRHVWIFRTEAEALVPDVPWMFPT